MLNLDACFDPIICDKAYIEVDQNKKEILGILNVQSLSSVHGKAKIPSLIWDFGCKTSDVIGIKGDDKIEINGKMFTVFKRVDDVFGMTILSLIEYREIEDYV